MYHSILHHDISQHMILQHRKAVVVVVVVVVVAVIVVVVVVVDAVSRRPADPGGDARSPAGPQRHINRAVSKKKR